MIDDDTRMSGTHLGEAFYRLTVSNFDQGSAVHEFGTLLDAVDFLATRTTDVQLVSETDDTVRLEGKTNDGAAVRIEVAYYHLAKPTAGWQALEEVTGR